MQKLKRGAAFLETLRVGRKHGEDGSIEKALRGHFARRFLLSPNDQENSILTPEGLQVSLYSLEQIPQDVSVRRAARYSLRSSAEKENRSGLFRA
jgi:hypothetical protein